MRYPARLLGLVGAAALIVPCVQIPGFSKEPRDLLQPERLLDERNLATTAQPEKQLQIKSVPVGPEAKGVVEQTTQTDSDAEPLLRVEGVLEPGDSTFTDDNSLYDTYTFEVEAGQAVIITLESEEFDTYLLLRDEEGNSLAQNDDISYENRNSRVAMVLSATGTYRVLAGAYNDDQQGAYNLIVAPTHSDNPAIRRSEADELIRKGEQLLDAGQGVEALELYEQALTIYQQLDDPQGEMKALSGLSIAHLGLGQVEKVIQFSQERLHIARKFNSRDDEFLALGNLGAAYSILRQYSQAIDYYQQSLAIIRELQYRANESLTLESIGTVYLRNGEREQAIIFYDQSLAIAQDLEDLDREGAILRSLGAAYLNLEEYQQALYLYQQSLAIVRKLDDQTSEGYVLQSIGADYLSQEQYQEALDYYEQSLAIAHELDNQVLERRALVALSSIYDRTGQYEKSINFSQQSLENSLANGDDRGIATALTRMGASHTNLGQYEQGVSYFNQSLKIARELNDHSLEGSVLYSLGVIHRLLGQYEISINLHEQSLSLARRIDDLKAQGLNLNALCANYYYQGQYERTIVFAEKALVIAHEVGDRTLESYSLASLGFAYDALSKHQEAISFYEQALFLSRNIEEVRLESIILGKLGDAHKNLGYYKQALEKYQQAIAISRDISYRAGEGLWLKNLGSLLADQNQSELAIIFYKQSVNVYESIRGNLYTLDTNFQVSYIDSVADTYRALANLLLQENRILEAQRVLDLLKVQELEDYLHDVQRSAQTEAGVNFWQVETDLLALYQQVIDQATELDQLEDKVLADRTTAEQQRLDQLRALRDEAEGWFYKFLDDPNVIATVSQIRTSTEGRNLEPGSFADLPNNLRRLPQKTAALYPLILEDRLELVLIMPDGPPLRYPVEVSSTDLNETIVAFGQALKSSSSKIEPLAQELYNWLIGPMAAQLEQAEIESIVYAPDGALRYIPLAALHDGEKYLAQRFSISHITADSLSDINIEPQRQDRRMLAAACAECSFTIPVGDEEYVFADLPYTQTEVQTLAAQVSGVDVLLNKAFDPAAMAELPSYTIVHLATHAAFVTGSPDESFIVFGSGDTINLRDLRRDWKLDNAELVVLSACETAVGSTELGSGIEILGLGYQIERAGAQATLASLWQVSDGGTQVLMNAFYAALQAGHTKAKALQLAQQALISGEFEIEGQGNRADFNLVTARAGLPAAVRDNLDHPYYWAPFILIGNGL